MKIIAPHNIESLEVIDCDYNRVIRNARKMVDLCFVKTSFYNGAHSISHCEVTKIDPLKFFVMRDGFVIVNPVIIKHSRKIIKSEEGCLLYPDQPPIIVKRWERCTFNFRLPDYKNKIFSEIKTLDVGGLTAKIFQHEIDHCG